jgi:DNA-binding response OmpR family regulator
MKGDPRVLIVESNEVLRAMLFTILRHQPVAVDTAATVGEALEKVTQCDYALIVVDLDMPGSGGSSFVAQLREHRPESTSFVLAVRDPRNDEFLDPEHVSAVLNKPIEIDMLSELVRECAHVVEMPEDPLPCNPAESEIRLRLEKGSHLAN